MSSNKKTTIFGILGLSALVASAGYVFHIDQQPEPEKETTEQTDPLRQQALEAAKPLVLQWIENANQANADELTAYKDASIDGEGRITKNDDNIYKIHKNPVTTTRYSTAPVEVTNVADYVLNFVKTPLSEEFIKSASFLKEVESGLSLADIGNNYFPLTNTSPILATYSANTERVCEMKEEGPDCFPVTELSSGAPFYGYIKEIRLAPQTP